MNDLKVGNLALAFAVEIAMLVAFAVAGWAASDNLWVRIALMLALPAIAAGLWGIWAAPKASKKTRLKPVPLLVFKVAIFGAATLAWWWAGMPLIAAIFGSLAAIHLVGAVLLRQI
jgi:hypothetical protein